MKLEKYVFPPGYQISTILYHHEKDVKNNVKDATKKAKKELLKTVLSCLDEPWQCCDHSGYRQGFNFSRYSIFENIKRAFNI